MSLADRIRAHVIAGHIQPARGRGESAVVVRAGDVHRDMGLLNSMPSVCNAIGGRRFAETAAVTLVDRSGPRNGANVYFTFSLRRGAPAEASPPAKSRQKAGVFPSVETQPRRAIDLSDALVLVSCVKGKRPRAARGRDLYVSAWFIKVRDLVESHRASWFILSALHGLVRPDNVIEPYERTLNSMGVADRRSWARKVLGQLEPLLESTPRVVFFAGERYREFLVDPLRDRGIVVEVPMEGLSIGRQLSWLSEAR